MPGKIGSFDVMAQRKEMADSALRDVGSDGESIGAEPRRPATRVRRVLAGRPQSSLRSYCGINDAGHYQALFTSAVTLVEGSDNEIARARQLPSTCTSTAKLSEPMAPRLIDHPAAWRKALEATAISSSRSSAPAR
jgi:hypothetical protein